MNHDGNFIYNHIRLTIEIPFTFLHHSSVTCLWKLNKISKNCSIATWIKLRISKIYNSYEKCHSTANFHEINKFIIHLVLRWLCFMSKNIQMFNGQNNRYHRVAICHPKLLGIACRKSKQNLSLISKVSLKLFLVRTISKGTFNNIFIVRWKTFKVFSI